MPDDYTDNAANAADGQQHTDSVSNRACYEDTFIAFSSRFETFLRRAAGTGLVLLVAAQLLLSVPVIRAWIVPVERMEGVPFQRYRSQDGP
ncbi:hypothetical protein D7M11_11480 [Paenibacillus ginsengarvi]|uniref:Uncharacterized protein n=2 Tax=Paenibacillus ginsengarvi TaxID=400777 RepID=A0A3B0CHR3_9BACL|nr:hypothetical protein D7M11_11480 [Paenibacillus ginsengarvi]